MSTAREVFEALGGREFMLATGARELHGFDDGLSVRRAPRADQPATMAVVLLDGIGYNPARRYAVTGYRIRPDFTVEVLQHNTDVPPEDLRATVARVFNTNPTPLERKTR